MKLDEAKRRIDLPEYIANRWPESGARPGQEGSIKAAWRRDTNASASLTLRNGVWLWNDFTTGAGGSIVDLLIEADGLPKEAAIAQVLEIAGAVPKDVPQAGKAKKADSWEGWTSAGSLASESVPPRDFKRSKWGKVSGVWDYFDADGRMSFVAVRYNKPNGDKDVRPWTVWRSPSGALKWRTKGAPAPRPLYRLPQLVAAGPGACVLVVEGEKAADAAGAHVPGYVAITWAGGAQGVNQADWSPVAGCDVVIWPDADQAGAGGAASVAHACRRVGASRVRVVALPEGLPAKWDLADFGKTDRRERLTPDWLTLEAIAQLVADAPEWEASDDQPVTTEPVADETAADRGLRMAKERFGLDLARSRYRIGTQGVGRVKGEDDDQERVAPILPRPLWPAALGVDVTTGMDMIKLAWVATDGAERTQWVRAGITGDRASLYALADRGAPVTIKNAPDVAEWLCEASGCVVPERRGVVVATSIGWADVPGIGRVFVWPGADGVEFIGEPLPSAGKPEAWAEGLRLLADLGEDGYLGLAAVGLSAAAPLVRPVGRRRPILGVAFKTSQGKTSILNLALSVWARPDALTIQAMNSTPKGVEEAAIRVPDLPVLLDDFQEPATADPKKAGHALYFLGNGQQRTTARKDGGASGGKPRFGVAFYASEFSIAGAMQGGADRRVVELTSRPLPEGCEELSDRIKAIAAHHGGAIAGQVLKGIGAGAGALTERAERDARELREHCPDLKGDDALAAALTGIGLELLARATGVPLPAGEVAAWLAGEAAAVRDERPDQSEEAFAVLLRIVDSADWMGHRAVQGGFELAFSTDTSDGPALDVNPTHEAIRRGLDPFGGEKRHRAAWADRGLIARDGKDLLVQKKRNGQKLRVLRVLREVCERFGMRAVPTGGGGVGTDFTQVGTAVSLVSGGF